MSWEVRTMRSATSYFNPTLYRKNLTRFWPIWGLYGVIWLLVLPVSLLTEADPGYAQRHPLRLLPEGALGMAVVFAILAAMAVFSYLYSGVQDEYLATYLPEQVKIDQKTDIENFPSDIPYADMSNDTPDVKTALLDKWAY